jgi:hypothetical protein
LPFLSIRFIFLSRLNTHVSWNESGKLLWTKLCIHFRLAYIIISYARSPPFQLGRLATVNESCSKMIRETVWFFCGTKICWKYCLKYATKSTVFGDWFRERWAEPRKLSISDLFHISLCKLNMEKVFVKKRKCPGMRLITRTGTLAFNLRFVMPLNWERI